MGKNCIGEETQDRQARKAFGKGGVFRHQGEIWRGEEGVAQNTQGVKRKRKSVLELQFRIYEENHGKDVGKFISSIYKTRYI